MIAILHDPKFTNKNLPEVASCIVRSNQEIQELPSKEVKFPHIVKINETIKSMQS